MSFTQFAFLSIAIWAVGIFVSHDLNKEAKRTRNMLRAWMRGERVDLEDEP